MGNCIRRFYDIVVFGIYFIKLGLLVPVCIGVLFCATTALQFLKGQENTRLIESFILSEAI